MCGSCAALCCTVLLQLALKLYKTCKSSLNTADLTRLVVHHADGFSFGQLQSCDPSLPFYLGAGLQVIGAAAAAQDDVAGVLGVDVCRGQVDGSTTCVGHLRLRPATENREK